MSQSLPELMTAEEVAEALRVSVSTISRWAKNGKIPFVKLGPAGARSTLRFRRDDVLSLLTGDRA